MVERESGYIQIVLGILLVILLNICPRPSGRKDEILPFVYVPDPVEENMNLLFLQSLSVSTHVPQSVRTLCSTLNVLLVFKKHSTYFNKLWTLTQATTSSDILLRQ